MRMNEMRRAAVAALVAGAGIVMAGCGADHVTGSTATVLMYIQSIVGQPQGGVSDTVLDSDVAIYDEQTRSYSVIEDYAVLELANEPKDPNQVAESVYSDIVLERYEVRFFRTDGRGVEGRDVPYSFSGPLAATVTLRGSTQVSFVLVRHQAKLEPPLLNLRGLGTSSPAGGEVIITAIAEIKIQGKTLAGDAVEATGRLQVNFADFADD